MAAFLPSTLTIDAEILRLLEAISLKQGELSAHRHLLHDEASLVASAIVDAVHYSTKLEGNSLSRDQVTRALETGKVKAPAHDLREVLNYSRVRRTVREWSLRRQAFNDKWILHHHSELMKGIVSGGLRGRYRTAQCAIHDSRTKAIVYMAPESRDVPELIEGLLAWLRRQKTGGGSPLLLAARFHFEFVTIHPFMDGNGRLARLLTNGILSADGYDVERYAALEKQHEKDRSAYYRSLRLLQAGNYYDIPAGQDIHSWAVYWLRCLSSAYDEALTRVAGVTSSIQTPHPHAIEHRLRRAESLFRRHHRLRASEYAELAGLGRTQAVFDLNALVDAGVIERIGGGRSTIYRLRTAG
jgi:Fic family protein